MTSYPNYLIRILVSTFFVSAILILQNQCWSQTIVRYKEPLQSLAFSPNSEKLISASSDGAVKIWNVKTRRVERTARNLKSTAYGNSMCPDWTSGIGFSPNGRVAAIGATSGEIKFLDISTGQFRSKSVRLAWESSLYFAPNAHIVADHDGQLWRWDVLHGFNSMGKIPGEFDAVAISSDGTTLVTGTPSYQGPLNIIFWSIHIRSRIRTLKLPWLPSESFCLALSPRSSIIAIAGKNRVIRLLNARSGKLIKILSGHHGTITCLAFSPDGTMLASGGDDSKVKLWQMK